VVWAGEVLEHVVDVSGLLANARLALREGGMLLATTPAHGPVLTRTARLDPGSDHLRFFTRRSLHSLLAGQFVNISMRRRRGRLYACAS
jgi:2-polyprenyl-3-methyl-5-hydroxy-6-metoxy-1,4-benzoquinol methylase